MSVRINRIAVLVSFIALLASCGSGSSASSDGGGTPTGGEVVAEGTLTLAGPDAALFGGELVIGDVARLNGPGAAQTYFCLDANSRVSGFDFDVADGIGDVVFGDPLNTFVLNAIDGLLGPGSSGVSMTIVLGGVDFDYLCTNCSGLSFDPMAEVIVFDDVEVDAIAGGPASGTLTLNGMIRYGIPE